MPRADLTQEPAPQLLRDVTPEAVAEARKILEDADHGALATLSPADGWPIATRVGLAMLPGYRPLIVISALAAHTAALRADPRCSLLVGTVGKGDPLANPRLTLKCRADEIADPAERTTAREIYLAAHPKSAIYIDLPDFAFMVLEPQGVSYNAGFGRAYAIDRAAFRG